jgi:hypothetical protein
VYDWDQAANLTAPIGGSPGQFVLRKLLDPLDVAGAAMEATADLGMIGAAGSPFQDQALHRAQFRRFRRDAGARYPCVGDHPAHELWSAPEAASDLGFIDALMCETQDATLERPQ